MVRADRQIVDVNLIGHAPERAKPGDACLGRPHDEDVADLGTFELALVPLARRRIVERRLFDREHAVEILGRREPLDDNRRSRVALSLAIELGIGTPDVKRRKCVRRTRLALLRAMDAPQSGDCRRQRRDAG